MKHIPGGGALRTFRNFLRNTGNLFKFTVFLLTRYLSKYKEVVKGLQPLHSFTSLSAYLQNGTTHPSIPLSSSSHPRLGHKGNGFRRETKISLSSATVFPLLLWDREPFPSQKGHIIPPAGSGSVPGLPPSWTRSKKPLSFLSKIPRCLNASSYGKVSLPTR